MSPMRSVWAMSGLLLFAGLAWMTMRPVPGVALEPTPAPDVSQFRILVGLRDTEAKLWAGRLRVEGGDLVKVQGWRFSAGDRINQDGTFTFQTKVANFENQLGTARQYGQTDWGDPNLRRQIPQGLIVQVRGAAAKAVFAADSGTFGFRADDVTFDKPAVLLEGNAVVERMPVEIRLSEAKLQDDAPAVAFSQSGERWAVWTTYEKDGDYVTASNGSSPVYLTEKGDHHSPTVTTDSRGWVHAAWSQREGSEFHIYLSTYVFGRWTRAQKMTLAGSSNIWPQLTSDGDKRIALVWQCLKDGKSSVFARVWEGRGWGLPQQMSEEGGNAWTPTAAFGGGQLWIAWDSYRTGAYQIYARQWPTGGVERVTQNDRFSVRPSIAVTAQGVPVVAWEESDALWGKDFAFLSDAPGTTLYKNRRIGVAFKEDNAWRSLPGNVADAVPDHMRRFVQQPRLTIDAVGRLHLGFRVRTSVNTARMDYWAAGGRWEPFLTSWSGREWERAVALPSGVGRNSMRMAIAAKADAVHAVWATDNRLWPSVAVAEVDVYAASVPARGTPFVPRGGLAIGPGPQTAQPHPNENADVAAIRAYRVQANGKSYRILRGDLHRHTELSTDGAGDGSLDDLYRYTLDAAQMDYAHVADHQMGDDNEYNWWMTQKSNDLYFLPERFVPLYGYERSVPYPNGHRNIVWASRGKAVLPIDAKERKGAVNSGSVVYPYLKLTDGIATSHSSATPQGTDWRDNDPALEPMVEIYQGFESNYEHEGAPRAWKEGDKAVHTGLRPDGYVWKAWAKGYKLGVQASSDHVSTHTSFACVVAEEFTRAGLLDAMRKRHVYAATDAIILDFRAQLSGGEAILGDIGESSSAPKLVVKIVGTAKLKQIDVIKNNEYVHQVKPGTKEASFTFADAAFGDGPTPDGTNYYYVRAEQEDGELVWSSPIWVKKK